MAKRTWTIAFVAGTACLGLGLTIGLSNPQQAFRTAESPRAHLTTVFPPPKPIADDGSFKLLPPADQAIRPDATIHSAPLGPAHAAEAASSNYPVIRISYEETPKLIDAVVLTRDFVLADSTCPQFEQRMLDVWGTRLAVTSEPGGRLVHVVLPTRQSGVVSMTIDRGTGKLSFTGDESLLGIWRRAMQALDSPTRDGSPIQVLDAQNAEPSTIQKAVAIMESVQIAGQEPAGDVRRAIPLKAGAQPGVVALPNGAIQEGAPQEQQGLSGPVRVEVIPEMNLIILSGKAEDVAYVQKVLNNLIKSADAAQPDVEVFPLQHASCKRSTTTTSRPNRARFPSRRSINRTACS
jgi:hypothetical protein